MERRIELDGRHGSARADAILMDRRLGVCGRYRLGRETDADAGAIHRGSESVQVLFVASQHTVSMGGTDQTASLVDLATE